MTPLAGGGRRLPGIPTVAVAKLPGTALARELPWRALAVIGLVAVA